MRNNIYRNFLKKVLKSEAFVSLAIVFVLALGIIGTSYALYMDVDTDTDYQLVKVGDLDVYIGFDNGDNTFSLSNVTPTDDEIALKSMDNIFSFYIYNGGNYTANYSIKLVPDYSITDTDGNAVTPNEIKPEYIRFQICKDNARNCKDVEKLSDYVTVDEHYNITATKEIYVDELSPKKENDPTNPSAYYFIRMWLTSEGYGTEEYDTNVIGKTIKYKVNVEAKNASGLLDNQNTLAGKLLSDDRVTINNTIPTFDGIADYKVTGDPTSGELGMFKAEDDYGISYYYRGAQSHNYVNFAGFTWRVVRINGDGSIRLILDGTLDKITKDGVAVYTNEKLVALDSDGKLGINTPHYNDNAYVGYMYGSFENNSTNYDEAHANINDSTIKTYIDTFYEEYLIKYQSYFADTLFCGDKTLAKTEIEEVVEQNGFAMNKTYYGTYERLYNSDDLSTPTLKCAAIDINVDNRLTEEQLAYSRYTSKLDYNKMTKKEVVVNNDLDYPIALLSADELVMAGGFKNRTNILYYLSSAYFYETPTSNKFWWTMSPSCFGCYKDGYAGELGVNNSNYSLNDWDVMDSLGVRPVINLKSDVLWASGDGTIDAPYEVKLY